MNVIKSTMDDDFKCACGNTASDYGFYPCDKKGKNMEPDHEAWDHHYKCDKCDQVYLYTNEKDQLPL